MRWLAAVVMSAISVSIVSAQGEITLDGYLSWPAGHAETVASSVYKRGRVGSFWGDRGPLQTERAQNYKLAATLFSQEVIRATARALQVRSRLSPDQTRELVGEAERIDGIVVMVELDPREGSGVIPLDWEAFLQPKGQSALAVRGVNTPELRNVKALGGVLRRNYDYDRFWVVFPRGSDAAYMKSDTESIQLVVRVKNQEGRVDWPAALLHAQ